MIRDNRPADRIHILMLVLYIVEITFKCGNIVIHTPLRDYRTIPVIITGIDTIPHIKVIEVNIITVHTKIPCKAVFLCDFVIKKEFKIDDIREDEVVPLKPICDPVIIFQYSVVILQ